MKPNQQPKTIYYRAQDEAQINNLPFFFGWAEIVEDDITGQHYKAKFEQLTDKYTIGYYKIEGKAAEFLHTLEKADLVQISQEEFNALLSKWTQGGQYVPNDWGSGLFHQIATSDQTTSATQRVFITRVVPQKGLDIILNVPNTNAEIWPGDLPPSRDVLLEKVQGIAGLYCLITDNIDEEVLAAAGPQLKVVSQMAVGYDNIDIAACTQRGIPVGNTPGVLTEATADLTLALMLGTARQLIPAAEAVKAGRWLTWEPMGYVGPEVYGSTVGLIGMGRIGLAVARRLSGFNVRLLYCNRIPSPAADEVEATYVDLDTLLAKSDFVSLHCPLTPETTHLINAERLKQMKSTAILINTARGGVVDQEALIEALRTGVIAYAGLDVTTPEPLSADNSLLTLPNVIVLPHIGSAGILAREKMAVMAAHNLVAGITGEKLPNCVNPTAYDKNV